MLVLRIFFCSVAPTGYLGFPFSLSPSIRSPLFHLRLTSTSSVDGAQDVTRNTSGKDGWIHLKHQKTKTYSQTASW
uniref:Putative secreted protein n=1 Tax=Anopheles darlingi TaxID=43151 RepID=A0A2M4DJA0_ANODA